MDKIFEETLEANVNSIEQALDGPEITEESANDLYIEGIAG